MACCGQNRRTYEAGARPVQAGIGFTSASGAPIFEYVGVTALTVTGSGTGRTYRFPSSGARLEVDRHDQESVARVPNLRRIR